MPLLAKATADEQGWRNLSKDECEELLQELEEDNTEAKVVKLVSPLNVASHYEKEFDRISAEVSFMVIVQHLVLMGAPVDWVGETGRLSLSADVYKKRNDGRHHASDILYTGDWRRNNATVQSHPK